MNTYVASYFFETIYGKEDIFTWRIKAESLNSETFNTFRSIFRQRMRFDEINTFIIEKDGKILYKEADKDYFFHNFTHMCEFDRYYDGLFRHKKMGGGNCEINTHFKHYYDNLSDILHDIRKYKANSNKLTYKISVCYQ